MPDKRLFRILPCAFVISLAIGIVNLGMLFLIKGNYGAGPNAVGWFTALWAAAYFVGCVVFRPLARRIDASTSSILMCFGSAAFLAAQFAFPSLAAAFVLYSLYGLASALVWPRLMAWLVSGLEGHALSRASGTYSISWSVGMTLSPYIAGVLSERARALPIYVGAVLFVATGLFMLITRRLAPAPPAANASDAVAAVALAATAAAKDFSTPLRYPAWLGLFVIYVLYSVLNNIFPLYAKDELAMSESAIGLFLLIRAAAMAIGFWVIGRLRFWQFKPVYLPLVLVLTLLLELAFALIRNPIGFCLGLIVEGAMQAFAYSLSIFYGASGSSDRDKRMSIHEAVLTAGQILGSIGGGAIYQGFSWPLVFVLAAAVTLLCAPVQLALARKR
jgi:MFS family permease